MPARARLWLITLLLLGGFFVRAHRPGALPGFVDELSHIERGEIIYTLERNPSEISHGKLLYYYWLGLFETSRGGALVTARLATALFTLLGLAGVAAAARVLFGPGAVLPATAFYAIVPFAVFFERMALADPMAAALGALAAWHSVLLARAPGQRRGLITGLLANGAMGAKLTAAPVLALPVLAAAIFGDVPWPDRKRASLSIYAKALWRRYEPAWRPIGLIFAAGWAIFAAMSLVALVRGGHPILLDTYLTDASAQPEDVLDKLGGLAGRVELLLTPGMASLVVLLAGLALWWRPSAALYTLAWLALLWGPSTLLASSLQTRYLVAGVPAVAVLVGGGIAALGRAPALHRRPRLAILARGTAAIALGVWAVAFALPFDWRAGSDPAALTLPRRDTYDYFWGSFNTWGTREALAYLSAHGEPAQGRVPAVGVLQLCPLATLYVTPALDWTCHDYYRLGAEVAFDPARWDFVRQRLDAVPWLYVVTEFSEVVSPDGPPARFGERWDLVFSFAKPHGERVITVWRVTAAVEARSTPG